jgi:hypothetical protein
MSGTNRMKNLRYIAGNETAPNPDSIAITVTPKTPILLIPMETDNSPGEKPEGQLAGGLCIDAGEARVRILRTTLFF